MAIPSRLGPTAVRRVLRGGTSNPTAVSSGPFPGLRHQPVCAPIDVAYLRSDLITECAQPRRSVGIRRSLGAAVQDGHRHRQLLCVPCVAAAVRPSSDFSSFDIISTNFSAARIVMRSEFAPTCGYSRLPIKLRGPTPIRCLNGADRRGDAVVTTPCLAPPLIDGSVDRIAPQVRSKGRQPVNSASARPDSSPPMDRIGPIPHRRSPIPSCGSTTKPRRSACLCSGRSRRGRWSNCED
jgi:hypothetical protein